MPTWGEILRELHLPANTLPNGRPDYDRIRRKYIAQLTELTGRATVIYATSFLEKDVSETLVQISLGDLQGFMETLAGVDQRQLDLIITSPGGLAEATESIVSYLRANFDYLRVFVPVAAMSAATMLALGADEVLMARHSQLGPIDPQFTIPTPEGPRSASAQAILEQFDRAKQECVNPGSLGAWMPILRGYGPGLLVQCVKQQELAQRMVRKWLEQYMLREDPEASRKAEKAASWFADYSYFGSHSRRVSLEDIQALGLRAVALEDDPRLYDAVLAVHHATAHTFNGTVAVKIIENHLGRAWVKLAQQIVIQQERGPVPPSQPPIPGQPSRAERRRQARGRR